MATVVYRFQGKAHWAKVWKNQIDMKYKTLDGSGKYHIQLDIEDMADFNVSGLRLRPNKQGFYTFSRPDFRIFGEERSDFGPPEVYGVPEGTPIGNGSDVTIEVAVYDTQMGKGHRLNKVTVNELVHYERPTQDKPPVN